MDEDDEEVKPLDRDPLVPDTSTATGTGGGGSSSGTVDGGFDEVFDRTTSDDTDHGSAAAEDGLTDTGWESDTGLLAIFGVADDDGGSARGTGESASVTKLGLNVGDDGALGHGVDGEDVADSEGGY